MTFIDKKLTVREMGFCREFVQSGDAVISAKRAGFSNPEQAALRLLSRDNICTEIERMTKQRSRLLGSMAAIGYQRLAFGDISDAVSLIFAENPSKSELDNMDLFLVSEIKRPKDGAMEIKFFDRIKALEKLENKSVENDTASSIFDAIGRSAGELGSDGDD